MMPTSGRLEELQAQLASVWDRQVKNDEECRQQMLDIEQEQEKNRQEIEQLRASKRQQKMERDNEYPQKKRNLEAKIAAERDAKVANLLDEYNEKFGREVADMENNIINEIARDEELVRIAYETFNAGTEMARAQSQALQATRHCQKAHEDSELLFLRQEIQVEREKKQRLEEVEERRRKIEEKKQEIEKMIQEAEEEEEILRRLQEEQLGDKGDTTILAQGIGADRALSELSKAMESFQTHQANVTPTPSTIDAQTQAGLQNKHQTTEGLLHLRRKDLNANNDINFLTSIGEELGQQFADKKKLLSTLNEAMSFQSRSVLSPDHDSSYLHYLQRRMSSSYHCHEIEKRHWHRLFSELCERHEINVSCISKSPFSEVEAGSWRDLASLASAGSVWVSLFDIFEPYLRNDAGVVVAAYSGDSFDIESLKGLAKEAFLSEIKSRCPRILPSLYAALPTFKDFLATITPTENSSSFAASSSPSSESYTTISESDKHWPNDAPSISGSSHSSISEDPETQSGQVLRVDLEAEKVWTGARLKIIDGVYTAPWWMKGVPVRKISETDPYWDEQWTKCRDIGMPDGISYFDREDCPVHLNQIVSKECIADGGKTKGLVNINYVSSLKAVIFTLTSWGLTEVEAFAWFRLRLGLQLEEHKKVHPDKPLGLRWKICQFSKTDRMYLTIKREVEATAHPRRPGKVSNIHPTPKLSGQHGKPSRGKKRRQSPLSHSPTSFCKLLEGAPKKARYLPGGPGGGGRWLDENGVETITPKSGSQKRNCKHESVPDHTEQKEICNSVLSDYDVEMPHVQEIVTFDLTHLESSQNRPILSHMNFQIHLDMGTEILKPGFDVAGPNAIEIPPEWQDYPELNIRLDKVTELKLGSSATDDKTVWIQHRHPSWNSTTYQEPQMKRSTVKLTFKKAEDAGRFLRIISPAIPKRCMPDVTDEIVQDHIR